MNIFYKILHGSGFKQLIILFDSFYSSNHKGSESPLNHQCS